MASYRELNTLNNSRSDTIVVATSTSTLQPGEPPDKSACVQFTGGDIQTALNAAANHASHAVYVHQGTWTQDGTKNVPAGVKIIGDGDSSCLNWTNWNNCGFGVSVANTGFYHLKLTTGVATNRSDWGCLISAVPGCTDYVVHDVTMVGGHLGLWHRGTSRGRITSCRGWDFIADAIHFTGCDHLYIAGNWVRHNGDDMVALISDAGQNNQILVENCDLGWNGYTGPTGTETRGGRGIPICGGTNLTFRKCLIQHSCWAGCYVANESAFPCGQMDNVIIDGNVLDGSVDGAQYGGHSTVLFYSDVSGRTIRNLNFTNNIMRNSYTSVWRIEGGCELDKIYIAGNTYNGSPSSPGNTYGTGAGITGCTEVTGSYMGGTTIPLPPPHWPGYSGPGA